MSDLTKALARKALLERLVGAHSLSMRILFLAGVVCTVNVLQNTFFTPMPWIMLIFFALMGCFAANRVRTNRIKRQLGELEKTLARSTHIDA